MSRGLKIDTDGRLAVSEADVQQACIDWMQFQFGYRYISTNASDLKRNGRPAHKEFTLDGLFINPGRKVITSTSTGWSMTTWTCSPPIVVEWKRRNARTQRARREGQEDTAQRLRDAGFIVIRMEDGLKDPIGWFKNEVVRVL